MNTKRILITGGRAPATLHLVRLLSRAGHIVFVADSVSFPLTKHSNKVKKSFLINPPNKDIELFKKDLLHIIKEENIDFLIPTCEETFFISEIKDDLEDCFVFTSNFETLLTLHSKYDFIETLKPYTKYVSIPKTYKIKSYSELNEISKVLMKEQMVFKPVFSRFGSEVFFSQPEKLVVKLDFSNDREWVLQEKINGYQVCSYSIVKDGTLQAFSCYKTDLSFGLGATVLFEPHFNKKVQSFVEKYVFDLNFTGQISFDFIVDKNENIYPIECNPRTTSGICLFDNPNEISESFISETNSVLIGNASSMLALPALAAIISSKKFNEIEKWKRTKDIINDYEDKKPVWYQFYTFVRFFILAKRNKITSSEATTLDIQWNGQRKDGNKT